MEDFLHPGCLGVPMHCNAICCVHLIMSLTCSPTIHLRYTPSIDVYSGEWDQAPWPTIACLDSASCGITVLGCILACLVSLMSAWTLDMQDIARCIGKRKGDQGLFIEPTLFADVKDDMRIAKEEIFGPVLCCMKWQHVDEVSTICLLMALAHLVPQNL